VLKKMHDLLMAYQLIGPEYSESPSGSRPEGAGGRLLQVHKVWSEDRAERRQLAPVFLRSVHLKGAHRLRLAVFKHGEVLLGETGDRLPIRPVTTTSTTTRRVVEWMVTVGSSSSIMPGSTMNAAEPDSAAPRQRRDRRHAVRVRPVRVRPAPVLPVAGGAGAGVC